MSKTILVVDDSKVDLELVANILESKGFKVIKATDGQQAINNAKAQKPDLIVLDVVMPGKDGYQTCRELKHDDATKDIKIIMLSSKDAPTDVYWGKKQGADDYLTKPLVNEDLLKSVTLLI